MKAIELSGTARIMPRKSDAFRLGGPPQVHIDLMVRASILLHFLVDRSNRREARIAVPSSAETCLPEGTHESHALLAKHRLFPASSRLTDEAQDRAHKQ